MTLSGMGILSLEIIFSVVDEICFAGDKDESILPFMNLFFLSRLVVHPGWLVFQIHPFSSKLQVPLRSPSSDLVSLSWSSWSSWESVTAWYPRCLEGHAERIQKIYERAHGVYHSSKKKDYPEFRGTSSPRTSTPADSTESDTASDEDSRNGLNFEGMDDHLKKPSHQMDSQKLERKNIHERR
nr:hypothetical protein Iba_chr13cCG12950 [Ipomoea batatas]